jgi:lipopolysaccharide biosynthesis regulator YciM
MAKPRPRRRPGLTEPEEVLTLAQRWLEPVKKYWKYMLVLGLIIVAVALGAGINAYLQARNESRADAALAQVNLQAPDAAPETQAVQGLENIIKEYPGTGAAREAALLRANLLYRLKNFGEAAKAYESLSRQDPELAPFIAESLSYCYEGLGDFKKAAAVLKPAADQVKGPFQGEVWRRLAFLYEKAGEPREAAPYWKKLLEMPNQAPGIIPYLKEKVAAAEAAK